MKLGNSSQEKKNLLFEKFGDYCLDISKLVFGGVILAAVMQLDINTTWLFVIGGIIVCIMAFAGYVLFRIIKNRQYGTFDFFISLWSCRLGRHRLGAS